MQDQYEVVHKSGYRHQVTKVGAMAFAQEIASAEKPSNWVRAVDPACDVYHVCDGWQGSYRVRFIDRLHPVTKDVIDFRPIWGVPRHSMQQFYDALKEDWPELPAFAVFRQAVANHKKMKNFLVHKEPDIELTRMRCPLISSPDQPGLPPAVAAVAAAPQSTVTGAVGAAAAHVRDCAFEPNATDPSTCKILARIAEYIASPDSPQGAGSCGSATPTVTSSVFTNESGSSVRC